MPEQEEVGVSAVLFFRQTGELLSECVGGPADPHFGVPVFPVPRSQFPAGVLDLLLKFRGAGAADDKQRDRFRLKMNDGYQKKNEKADSKKSVHHGYGFSCFADSGNAASSAATASGGNSLPVRTRLRYSGVTRSVYSFRISRLVLSPTYCAYSSRKGRIF